MVNLLVRYRSVCKMGGAQRYPSSRRRGTKLMGIALLHPSYEATKRLRIE